MTLERLIGRPRTLLPFGVIGACCIIAGGMLAAVVAHSPTEHQVWAVAYLVLVPGVVQVALGVGETILAAREPSPPALLGQVLLFNVGNGLVIAGTVTERAVVTDVGSALLVIALATFVVFSRGAHTQVLRWVYQTLVVIVLVSVPVGIVIQYVKGH